MNESPTVVDFAAVVDADAPLFIGGLNRSGTSLMRALLGSHSQVALPPSEPGFFESFSLGRSARLDPDAVDRAVADVLGWSKIARWELDGQRVLELAQLDPTTRGVFVAIHRAYAEQQHRPRFGSKNTHLERELATFDRWFPSGYGFVQMVRHPVPAYASQRFYDGVEQHVDPRAWSVAWLRSAAIAVRALRRRPPGVFVLVRYEDLVAAPEDELRRVCEALGLPYEPAMLEMADFEQKENSSFTPETAEYDHGIRRHDSVERAALLRPDELRVVRGACRSSATVLGYDVDDETRRAPAPSTAAFGMLARTTAALAVCATRSLAGRALHRVSG